MYRVWALMMLESSLRHHPGQLDETKADDSQAAGQSARPPQVRLWEIAERVLVVTETNAADARQPSGPDTTISASSSELAQMIAASPDLLERVTGSSLSVCRPGCGSGVFVGGVNQRPVQRGDEAGTDRRDTAIDENRFLRCGRLVGNRRVASTWGCTPDDAASVSRGWFRRIAFDEHRERMARAYSIYWR